MCIQAALLTRTQKRRQSQGLPALKKTTKNVKQLALALLRRLAIDARLGAQY